VGWWHRAAEEVRSYAPPPPAAKRLLPTLFSAVHTKDVRRLCVFIYASGWLPWDVDILDGSGGVAARDTAHVVTNVSESGMGSGLGPGPRVVLGPALPPDPAPRQTLHASGPGLTRVVVPALLPGEGNVHSGGLPPWLASPGASGPTADRGGGDMEGGGGVDKRVVGMGAASGASATLVAHVTVTQSKSSPSSSTVEFIGPQLPPWLLPTHPPSADHAPAVAVAPGPVVPPRPSVRPASVGWLPLFGSTWGDPSRSQARSQFRQEWREGTAVLQAQAQAQVQVRTGGGSQPGPVHPAHPRLHADVHGHAESQGGSAPPCHVPLMSTRPTAGASVLPVTCSVAPPPALPMSLLPASAQPLPPPPPAAPPLPAHPPPPQPGSLQGVVQRIAGGQGVGLAEQVGLCFPCVDLVWPSAEGCESCE
jgi:hypothetical protein